MPKPIKQNKNKRDKAVIERTVLEPELVPRKKKTYTEGVTNLRISNDLPINKCFLILCEGPTEAAYFEGLCEMFGIKSIFTITVLPDPNGKRKNNSEGYQGSSVKGLLYLAMQKQKQATIPYDEVWIVTDNDEENGYKLDNESLFNLKSLVPIPIYEKLQSFQIKEMNVREVEKNKSEHLRKRYFLSLFDYENFLKTYILDTEDLPYLPIIVKNTTKKRDFTDLYSGNSKIFFYDEKGNFITTNNKGEKKFEKKYFDENWQSYIKVAYSCIAFEYWLLLHFEKNTIGFYNSREVIKHFDDKEYFNSQFEKGWYLYEKRDLRKIKDFFKNAYQAIQNNIWLNTFIQPQIKLGKTFYEVNPYSDVFCLVSLLLNQQDMRLAYLNEPISHFNLNDICVSKPETIITIVFLFDRKQSIFRRNIESFFSLMDENRTPILANITSTNDELIRQGDFVKIEISLSENIDSLCFLVFKEKIKGTEYSLIWLV